MTSAPESLLLCVKLFQLSSSLRIKTVRPSTYHEAKQAALEYHSSKQTLFRAFQKAGLGAWVKKPIEQDQFALATWVTVSAFTLPQQIKVVRTNFQFTPDRAALVGGVEDVRTHRLNIPPSFW